MDDCDKLPHVWILIRLQLQTNLVTHKSYGFGSQSNRIFLLLVLNCNCNLINDDITQYKSAKPADQTDQIPIRTT